MKSNIALITSTRLDVIRNLKSMQRTYEAALSQKYAGLVGLIKTAENEKENKNDRKRTGRYLSPSSPCVIKRYNENFFVRR